MKIFNKFAFFILLFVTNLALGQVQKPPAPWIANVQSLGNATYWNTPSTEGHQPFIDSIMETNFGKLSMFHLTDPAVVAALKASAQKGNKFQIIINRGGLADADTLKIALDLQATPNIDLRASPSVFSLLHTKALWAKLQNGIRSLVTTINLTTFFLTTRDHGISTDNPGIFAEGTAVFDLDFQNSETDLNKVASELKPNISDENAVPPPASFTPPLSHPNLVWSPINSQEKIVDILDLAQSGDTVIATVENIRNQPIQDALVQTAARGVKIRFIVPEVDQNPDTAFNFQAIEEMFAQDKTGNLEISVMPLGPGGVATADFPYMHAKMICVISPVASRNLGMISSENFSNNSLLFGREVGVFFREIDFINQIAASHAVDWKASIPAKQSKFYKPLAPTAVSSALCRGAVAEVSP